MHFRQLAAFAASVSVAAAVRGFNTGSTQLDGTAKQQSDFAAEFSNQRQLQGVEGVFTAARLYTMIQAGTTSSPISAIPAAIASKTQLLLGLWASEDQAAYNYELAALTSAIKQYGTAFTDLVTGIAVGSEDLYRITAIGVENGSPVGAGPETVTSYINQAKNAIKGTTLAKAPVGHVDTWTAWTNSSNSAVVDACDFVGVNEFPYYQTQQPNAIGNAKNLFDDALAVTREAAGGKPVWVTETGWPSAGPNEGPAVANKANARTYWEEVYCTFPEDVNLFWFTQTDDNPGDKATFGLAQNLGTTPAFDLSCKDIVSSSSSASATSHTATATSGHASSHATATGTSGISGVSGSGPGSSGGESGSSGSPGSSDTESGSESGSDSSSAGSSSGASATGAGQATAGLSTTAPAPYPTAANSGFVSSAAPSYAAGTGGVPVPSSTVSPYSSANGASTVHSTLALLAVPALMALLL